MCSGLDSEVWMFKECIVGGCHASLKRSRSRKDVSSALDLLYFIFENMQTSELQSL